MTTVSAVRSMFPNLQLSETGGHCTALQYLLGDGRVLNITGEDGMAPDDTDTTVYCTLFNPDTGDGIDTTVEVSVDELESWIDNVLGFTGE